MRCGNFKSLLGLFYAFSAQSTKTRKNYVNIGKIMQKEQQASTIESNSSLKYTTKKRNQFKTQQNNEPTLQMDQQDWFPKSQQKTQHMSTQQQQMNHKIKTAIRCQTLYYQCSRKKHKLELRQYALIFCKILELRRMNPSQRRQTEQFINFLSILSKRIPQMPPQQLVRMVYGIKQQRVGLDDMRLMLVIVQKIIEEIKFSNTQSSELQPKSFETLRLSTNIKLFYSLLYILSQTGAHFQKRLKSFMNQTLNYILFKSMKTKKHSKTGQYFPLQLKIAFLHTCKLIQASNACVKNLMLSILVEKQRLTLEMLLDLETTLFENKELLEKTRKQLFTEKDIHVKYNILYRIERYINDAIPANIKKPSTYSMLSSKLASHLSYISQLTFQELNVMELASVKDEQQSGILALFHNAYKNALIEDYSSLSEKEDVVAFFDENQNEGDTLFELMGFFCGKLKIDGGNSLRPSVKKDLKEFISLLCKFFGKLNFLTQSVIIDILILSNFANLKPIITQFLEINTPSSSSKKQQKPHFIRKNKTLMMDNFSTIIKHQSVFQQHCPSQYQLFINSNLKSALKQIFKSTQPMNIQKYAFYLSQYCKVLTKQSLQALIQSINLTHKQISWTNKSFKKVDVDIIYKNKDHFLSTETKQSIQIQNQTDIFGQNVAQKQQRQVFLNDNLLSTVQNDKQVFRDFYKIQQKIRVKLRMALKNFKFIILLFENIKLNVPKESWEDVINEELISGLVLSFKSELECLKFERFLTKENCSDLTEIQGLLKNIWDRTLPEVEVRNQALLYENESAKSKPSPLPKQKSQQQNQSLTTSTQNLTAQKTQQEQPLNEQEEQQSEQSEYTQQVEYLHGKDFFKLETFKEYQQKQEKNALYFYNKNKEIIQQIKALTNDFAELPKTMKHQEKSIQVLKELQMHYSPSEKIDQNEQPKRKIIDLTTIDNIRVQKENLEELVNIEIENRENKQIYTLRVFRKSYPSLVHFSTVVGDQQGQVIERVLYVNGSKVRKNCKKKKVDESKALQDEPQYSKSIHEQATKQ